MANDTACASNLEEWLVDTFGAVADIPADNVVVFEGLRSYQGDLGAKIDEIRGNRTPWLAISWESMRPKSNRAVDSFDWECNFIVLIAVQNPRPGAARIGDVNDPAQAADAIGTNRLRELIVAAIRGDQYPGEASDFLRCDLIQPGPQAHIFGPKGVSVVQCEFTAHLSEV